MVESVRETCRRGVLSYPTCEREQWVLEWPGQVVLVVTMAFWTREVTAAISQPAASKALAACATHNTDQLAKIVNLVRAQGWHSRGGGGVVPDGPIFGPRSGQDCQPGEGRPGGAAVAAGGAVSLSLSLPLCAVACLPQQHAAQASGVSLCHMAALSGLATATGVRKAVCVRYCRSLLCLAPTNPQTQFPHSRCLRLARPPAPSPPPHPHPHACPLPPAPPPAPPRRCAASCQSCRAPR